MQGSTQRLRITKFKTDPHDRTIGLGILVVKAFNADFDGDATSVLIALDNKMAKSWYPLSPKFNILQLTNPFDISMNISIPKPVIASISNYLENETY